MPPKRHLSEEELEAAKQRKAEYDRQRRQAMCDEAKACERERIRNLRDNMTDEDRAKKRDLNAQQHRDDRSSMTDEDRATT